MSSRGSCCVLCCVARCRKKCIHSAYFKAENIQRIIKNEAIQLLHCIHSYIKSEKNANFSLHMLNLEWDKRKMIWCLWWAVVGRECISAVLLYGNYLLQSSFGKTKYVLWWMKNRLNLFFSLNTWVHVTRVYLLLHVQDRDYLEFTNRLNISVGLNTFLLYVTSVWWCVFGIACAAQRFFFGVHESVVPFHALSIVSQR